MPGRPLALTPVCHQNIHPHGRHEARLTETSWTWHLLVRSVRTAPSVPTLPAWTTHCARRGQGTSEGLTTHAAASVNLCQGFLDWLENTLCLSLGVPGRGTPSAPGSLETSQRTWASAAEKGTDLEPESGAAWSQGKAGSLLRRHLSEGLRGSGKDSATGRRTPSVAWAVVRAVRCRPQNPLKLV